MKRILIVGCGDIARRIIPLLNTRYRVFALVRNPDYCAGLRELGAVPLIGDLDKRASLSRIAGLVDTVLHLAPPAASGLDRRTRNLLSALSSGVLPERMVYISTSGVYGDCKGAWVNETHPLNAESSRALRRIESETLIRNWAKQCGVRASILRVPGIYAADRLPLARLQQGTPGIADAEDSYTNHIHADDLARICIAALHRGKPCRIYHASDDSQLKMGEYFDAVADAYGLPHVPRISRVEAQQLLSSALLSFMNESRRLSNERLKRELQVRLMYPTVADFLAKINQG